MQQEQIGTGQQPRRAVGQSGGRSGGVVAFRRPSMLECTVMARGFDEGENVGFIWAQADNGDKLMMVALDAPTIGFTRDLPKGARMDVDQLPLRTTRRPDRIFPDQTYLVAFRPGPGAPLPDRLDQSMLSQCVLWSGEVSAAMTRRLPNQHEALCAEIRRARAERHGALIFVIDRAA